jgi:hypothetical protein
MSQRFDIKISRAGGEHDTVLGRFADGAPFLSAAGPGVYG